MATELSIVIPVFNEEGNLDQLFVELKRVIDSMNITAEFIFVDDGSTDASWAKIAELYQADNQVVAIKFRRNFGQSAALAAGFDHARGEVIITIDADLQNDPADFPKLLAKIKQGFDVVSGWRQNRKEPYWSRRLPSGLANKLIVKLTSVRLHDYGCTLKAYRREVIKEIKLYGQMHRFLPVLAYWHGARITEIPVRDRPRQSGHSKYNLSRTLPVVLDLLTIKFLLGYSTRPMHIFGKWGIFSIILSIFLAIVILVMKFGGWYSVTGNPLLYIAILLFLVGVQLITMGLLGEISVRTYHESQNRPIYSIRQQLHHQGH